jgi:hypothetical protein
MPRLITLLALLTALFAAGCRQSAPTSTTADSLQVAVTAEPNPPVSGKAQLVIIVKDASGSPVSDATVSARGDMTHAGMVPVIRDNVIGTNGIYSVPFEWTMGGDWSVDVTVRLRDGTATTRTFRYSVGESGSMSMDMDMSATAESTASGMSGMDMPMVMPTKGS